MGRARVPYWTWMLCDANGAAIAELANATGRTITYRRNTYVEAQCTLSHEDEAGALILSSLAAGGVPTLKTWRRGLTSDISTLRFRGHLVALQEVAEETSLVTATFRSPFGVLLGDGNERGRFVRTSQSFTATDAGQIAKALVDATNAVAATGLVTTGTIEATKIRDRSYASGTNIGQALINLTNVLDGFDFYETFLDDPANPAALAQLQIVASQGTVKDAARFEYGPDTLANVRGLTRDTQMPANSVFVLGGVGLTSTYEDANSIGKYGEWHLKAEFVDVSEQATLDDKARALVRPNPVRTITFTPEAALAPQPFEDYDLGDTVMFFARRAGLNESAPVRVNGFTIAIDDNGYETTDIADPSMPDSDASLFASLTVEVA